MGKKIGTHKRVLAHFPASHKKIGPIPQTDDWKEVQSKTFGQSLIAKRILDIVEKH